MIFVTATQTPAIAATMGMIQTSASRVRFLATTRDSGTLGSDWSLSGILNLCLNCFRTGGIPDQPRVERLDRKHGQHHDRGKEKKPGCRLDGHERLKLDQG